MREPALHLLPTRRQFLAGASTLSVSVVLRGIATDLMAQEAAERATLRIQKLAWAGVRLVLDKATLFLDPLVNPDVWGPALKEKIIPIEAADGDRFVLVTHRHPDHFDPVAIRKALGETGILVCNSDVASLAAGAGFRVRVAETYEPVLLGDFTATAVPATDGYGDPQVSWIVSGGGRRILHCGDTLWHGTWWRIGRQYGPFDAAFLPINGARFEWRKPVSDVPAVLTPEQAVAAAVIVHAKIVVPIHYGVSGAEGYKELPDCERLLFAAAQKRGIAVEVVPPGEWLTWQPRTASNASP
jgi:L-ascorbate metabolism protein UlaG (beta-lactamase superfamily)